MASKSFVIYAIIGLTIVSGIFLYYRNSTVPPTLAPATTTTAPTTVAPTLAPYVPWYSPPQLPAGLQIVPKSNMSCQQCVAIQQDLHQKMNISSLLQLNTNNLNKQVEELGIELEKRGKTRQEIQEQFEFLVEKSDKFIDQLLKYQGVDITRDICRNMCPTCLDCRRDIINNSNSNEDRIKFCMNGSEKASEACEVFRKTGVTPSPMMTVPPLQ